MARKRRGEMLVEKMKEGEEKKKGLLMRQDAWEMSKNGWDGS